jgi:DNA-directed RNA polymerase subunit RPC12/RpoP
MSIKKILNKKIGNRIITCKRCGKRIGIVKPKLRFSIKVIFYAILVAIVTQVIGQIISDLFFKFILKI